MVSVNCCFAEARRSRSGERPTPRACSDVFSLLLLHLRYNVAELAAMREVKNRFDPR
jgi:hypothetical protein